MKITAYSKKNRIPMSLSNYMAGCREGTDVAKQTFIDTIKSVPHDYDFDAAAICKALNAHKWTTETFKPYRPLTNGISLIAVDPWGNEDIIQITED